MGKAICKVFAFLLNIGKQVIDAIADTLVYVGTAAVEVLSDVVSAASDGLLSSPIGIAVVAVGGFFLLKTLGLIGGQEEEKLAKPELRESANGALSSVVDSNGVWYV